MESVLVILSVLSVIYVKSEDSEGFISLAQQVSLLDEELRQVKIDIPRVEDKLVNSMKLSQMSFKAELTRHILPELIESQIRATLLHILRDKSLEDAITIHVTSEIRDLEKRHAQLKTQHQHVLRILSQLKRRRCVGKSLSKDSQRILIKNILSTIHETKPFSELRDKVLSVERKVETLTDELAQRDSENIYDVNEGNFTANDNLTYERVIHKLDKAEERIEILAGQIGLLSEQNGLNGTLGMKTEAIGDVNATASHVKLIYGELLDKVKNAERNIDKLYGRTALLREDLKILGKKHVIDDTVALRKMSTNTQMIKGNNNLLKELSDNIAYIFKKGNVWRSKVLIVPFWSKKSYQLTVNDNQLAPFHYLNTSYIAAVTFDPSSNRILFSRDTPSGIYSVNLDGTDLSILRNNIKSGGMAVDEGRELLFLTTYSPRKTVSRMRTDGKTFSSIADLSRYSNSPLDIAVDSRMRMIYITNHDNLLSATYEGRNLRTLYTGWIFSVAIDMGRGFLYFHDSNKIVRWSIFESTSMTMTTVGDTPYRIAYYNNTVYVSSQYKGQYPVYALNVNNDVLKKVATVDERSLICLLP